MFEFILIQSLLVQGNVIQGWDVQNQEHQGIAASVPATGEVAS